MLELYNLGISEDEIKELIGQCGDIVFMDNDEVIEKIKLLEMIGCSNSQIRNIIICNPCYLIRFKEDLVGLFKKFIEIGIDGLEMLFDSNPFLLNIDAFEIDNYIKKKIYSGTSKEDILDGFWNNPNIIDEI